MRCGWSKAFIATSHHSCRRNPAATVPFTSSRQRSFRTYLDLRPGSNLSPPQQYDSESSPHITEDFYLDLLSLCTNSKSARQGICVHSPIIKLGFHGTLPLNNHLFAFYSRFAGAETARKLFDELTERDVVTWTGIISTYSRIRNHVEALFLFKCMLEDDSPVVPNEFTFSSAIHSAASLRLLDLGTQIHAQVWKRGFDTNTVVGSVMLDVYAKCSRLKEALEIFASMDYRDVISWTTMISALVKSRDWIGAMQMYSRMIENGTSPTEFTFAELLKACGCFFALRCALMLHAHLLLWGVELNLVLKTALIDMYLKCGRMNDALKVFRQTTDSDVKLWTTMISRYSQAERYQEAISMFKDMKNAGVMPNSFTYAAILSVSSSASEPELGKQIHCRVVKAGLEHDLSVANSLVDLYAKYSLDPVDMMRAFRGIASPNVVSWTAFIAGLARHGFEQKALLASVEMRLAGVEPNSYTLSTVLTSCNSAEALPHARKLQAFMIKTKVESPGLVAENSLVDAYARFGRVDDALAVANTMMPHRDVFTYTSLAKGLNQVGLHRRALDLIACMHKEDVKIDGFSLSCFLSAAAGLAATELGKQFHGLTVKSGLSSLISVSNALIDMYGKCGSMEESRRIFMAIKEPDVVSWNGLISALASNGLFMEALSTFEDMRIARAQPDGVTFLLVLYACSHGGLVDAGVEYFNSMHEVCGVMPQPEHYVCLVDMLGRVGRLEAAACAIETMPFQADALIYKTLLASCRQHGNLVLGECTARKALEIDPLDPAIYVLLASIYDDAGNVEWAEQTRRMMRERATKKCKGQSWLE
ncbi:hypothetical protein Cni_G17283 [Canna indica]|uniref:Pentatricopeptide repeat-containing protein n=1 Tax=Canna indica TaxID=4628 RepID=A0AAQ3KGP0_9LILI|nr:hypothetical protein Cni_G17283 [Canna indica]